MNSADFQPVIELMKNVGKDIVNWRDDVDAKRLYSSEEFKTEADRRAHNIISNGLHKLFPKVEVISEEDAFHKNSRPNEYWLIDPIDGTASWYHGYDGFVTQAALIKDSLPVFGVVHAPVFDKTWSALKGEGALLNGNVLPKLVSNTRLVLIDNTNKPHGISQQVSTALLATGYYECGSLGLKSVLVADGTADLFIKNVCVRDWDLAPAAVILNEVNACLVKINGEPYNFDGSFTKNEGFVVARDSNLLKRALKTINQIMCRDHE